MILKTNDIYSMIEHFYDDCRTFDGYFPTNRMIMLGKAGCDLRVVIFRSAWETHPEHSEYDISRFDGLNISEPDYDVRTFTEEQMKYALMNYDEPCQYHGMKPREIRFLGEVPDITAEVRFEMNAVEQLRYLIEHYSKGEYTAWDFSSQFTNIYYINHDESLTEEYKEYYLPLAECCKMFSPYREDLNLPDSPFKSKEKLDEIVRQYFKE